eukprot:TRINITY_DN674_c0_g1_i2.p1 TRINITY_DN674_c0_g1~~TRINITY_DN674_c0_g1_i2.p1  ORF type:complete len:531 (-),score=119.32 TRINITY_DN674_c0_g1_i2:291-1883(-)
MGFHVGFVAVFAAMAAAAVAMVSVASAGSLESRPSLGFVVSPSVDGAAQRISTTSPAVKFQGKALRYATEEANSQSERSGIFVAAVLGLSAVAALAARRRRDSSRAPNVGMYGRGHRRFLPGGKGLKPMIHRAITRNILTDTFDQYLKKNRSLDDIEGLVKNQLSGKMFMQFSSQHFTDEQPLAPADGKINRGAMGGDFEHKYDDAFYRRKFLEPAKFKKLAIAAWEMPENFTKSVSLKELVDAGVQYGHKSNQWNPSMMPYLYADHQGTHIFDLVQTAAALNRSCYYVMEAAARGANFLYVGTKSQARPVIAKEARRVGASYCSRRFVGGVLSNFPNIRENVVKMQKWEEDKRQGKWNSLNKGEQDNKLEQLRIYEKFYKGIENMTDLPDICIFVDELKERKPLAECHRLGIPTVGLLDSNNNPKFIDLPIPGNASSSRSIELVIGKLTEAIARGQAIRERTAVGDREKAKKEWDPWIFSKDRIRSQRRRSKRQPWMKAIFGGYEQWKKANPFGHVGTVVPYHNFEWQK